MAGKLICPNCGSEVRLPETSSLTMGMTLSKACGGTHYLDLEKVNNKNVNKTNTEEREEKCMTKAQERIEVLKNRGIDVTNYFAINDDTVIKMENGVPTVVPMQDDPIVKQIISDGDVFNAKLDGRWIMAQMFHMLNYENRYRRGRGYNDALNDKGYMYQWEMLVGKNHGEWTGELLRLEARERDGEDLSVKQIWFNGDLVSQMILDYIVCLRRYINSLPTYLCKGKLEYKRLGDRYEKLTKKPHGDVFLEDLESVVYGKYRKYAADAKYVRSYKELVKIVKDFKRDMIRPSGYYGLNKNFKMSQAFKDAYKGNGAYYTAANLIRFHGCKVDGKYDKAYSMAILDERTREACGWKLLGFLKELIEDNHFDFNARMAELNV